MLEHLREKTGRAIPALIAGWRNPHTRVRRGCVDTIDHGGYGGDARCIEALLPRRSIRSRC